MRPDVRRAFYVFLATVGAGVLLLVIFVASIWSYPSRTSGGAKGTVEIEIPRGVTAQGVAELLERGKLISSPLFFRLYTAQRGAASRIRPGHYQVQAPITPKELVDHLVKGVADRLIPVTIPEGKNFVEIAEILDAAGVTRKTEFVATAINSNVVHALDLPGLSLEGYLFPDTYRLRPRMPAPEVAELLVRRHKQVYQELAATYSEGLERLRRQLGFEDRHVVILASIVEKETGRAEERPRIAQLNINRLTVPNFNPRVLATDPTIIYGCTIAPLILGRTSTACQKFHGNNIQTIHLRDADNEYNTYVHEGLPPGPIANPGRASLAAVMKPDGSPYLYFVAQSAGGVQVFSTTLAEHEANVVKYQRGGRPMPSKKK
jgi:UPF0755 protein